MHHNISIWSVNYDKTRLATIYANVYQNLKFDENVHITSQGKAISEIVKEAAYASFNA